MQSVAADNKAKVRRLRGRSLARSLASAAGRTKTARAIERLVKEVLKEREREKVFLQSKLKVQRAQPF